MQNINPVGALSFRIAATIICITCIFYSAVMRRLTKRRLRTRLFMLLLAITFADSVTGIISTIVPATDLPYRAKFIIVYLSRFSYYCTHFMVAPIFWLYISVVCDVYYRYTRRTLLFRFLPFIILEIAVFTNPFTHFIFIPHNNLVFSRGVGIYVAYFVSILYMMFCIYLLSRYWRTMSVLQKIAMFYFLGLVLVGAAIQMVFSDIISELFCEALGLMGIMIMIERDDYRLDYKTRANNRGSLVLDLNNLIENGRNFYVICVRVITTELYRRVLGYANFDMVTAQIADFLMDLHNEHEVYRTTGGQFFVICKDVSQIDVDIILDKIENRFEQSFDTMVGPTDIKVKILCAKCPEEMNASNDILLLQDANVDDTDKIVLKGKDINFLLRRIEVEKAIVRSINSETFMVKYQPVYDKDSLRIKAAEALLTLRDVELGEVQFAEFMSVAEDTGFVEELEFRMIESVFRFIKAGVVRSNLDIKAMIVHIMSVQVIKGELVEKVTELIDQYGVDPSLLVFDVSDTIAIQAQEELGYIIDEFAKMNVKFTLLNNDSGFLGLGHNIIDKLDGIVINVKRIGNNSDKEQEEILLRNRISMVRQLGKEVILSGIDDRERYDLVRDKVVNSIIGDYLCGPVTKNELQTKFWHGEVFYEKPGV